MPVYDLRVEGNLGPPSLPEPTAPLCEQREAIRALRALYPKARIRLRSIAKYGGKTRVRELQVDTNGRRK